MSQTKTEEKPQTGSDEVTIPDWAMGYALTLPCEHRTPQCDNEADWFASQHGCIRAHICDDHMQRCYKNVRLIIAEYGGVQCRVCKSEFTNFAAFIKAVKI